MTVENIVEVNTHYTRSINLERDCSSSSVVDAYIPTTRAIDTLHTMLAAWEVDESPRAWSLVGPYGSGKSSFAVFLSHIIGDPSDPISHAALGNLAKVAPQLVGRIEMLTRERAGYCAVLLTGSGASFSRCLLLAMAYKAQEVLHKRCKIIGELFMLAEQEAIPDSTEIIAAIKKFQEALSKKYCGLLIVVDELGKFLEFEARHNEVHDIYLLQALAEHAVSANPVKLSIVVMLHQSFDQYARGFGEKLTNEWTKVQGRYENISFLETSEQTLRILGKAIEHKMSRAEKEVLLTSTRTEVKALVQAGAISSTLDEEDAVSLFAACYPLHPVSALLLPILCQKVAQNERTLFSYLGSREAYGFQESLRQLAKVGDWIFPWEIYEYFVLNQTAALSDHYTHRRWSEVVTAVERLGDAHSDEISVLKTIGLLNIVGGHGGFKASKEVIELCLTKKSSVRKAVKNLCKKSIVQYRKFSSEYRVWQGSDFDLDALVENEMQKMGRFSVADVLNDRHSLSPIVARKYTIQSGGLRYFQPTFLDGKVIDEHGQENGSEHAQVIFYLSENQEDEAAFFRFIKKSKSETDIYVLCANSDQLRWTVAEILSLDGIERTSQELNSDPVAAREFKDRYGAALVREKALLDLYLSEPHKCKWYWCGQKQTVDSRRSFQEILSQVLQKVYAKSPTFMNELINRDRPSAQANAARNKLAISMFEHEAERDLGIDKFPPEKAIYRACLQQTKLHVQHIDGHYYFRMPKSGGGEEDPCNLYPIWQRIDAFLDSTKDQAKPLIELNQELMAAPYGVKQGMLPILYLAVLVAQKKELAIYESQVYTPHFSREQIERFMKRPDEFSVQRFRITGLNHSIHEVYSSALFNDGKTRSLLELAKPIARMVLNLPHQTLTTKEGLSLRARSVRNLFKLSKSPIKLMLEELPKALDIDLEKAEEDEPELNKLSGRLIDVLRELQHCLPQLKSKFQEKLAEAFGQEGDISLADLQSVVAGRCRGLEGYTIDRDGLRAFIQRATKSSLREEVWFDDLLSFLGQKPVEKWGDDVSAIAAYRLTEMMNKLRELERLRLHYQDHAEVAGEGFEVYLLRSVKKGAADLDEVVVVDEKKSKAVKDAKMKILSTLEGVGGEDLQMAALAELVDEFLSKRREENMVSKKVKNGRVKKKRGH